MRPMSAVKRRILIAAALSPLIGMGAQAAKGGATHGISSAAFHDLRVVAKTFPRAQLLAETSVESKVELPGLRVFVERAAIPTPYTVVEGITTHVQVRPEQKPTLHYTWTKDGNTPVSWTKDFRNGSSRTVDMLDNGTVTWNVARQKDSISVRVAKEQLHMKFRRGLSMAAVVDWHIADIKSGLQVEWKSGPIGLSITRQPVQDGMGTAYGPSAREVKVDQTKPGGKVKITDFKTGRRFLVDLGTAQIRVLRDLPKRERLKR